MGRARINSPYDKCAGTQTRVPFEDLDATTYSLQRATGVALGCPRERERPVE